MATRSRKLTGSAGALVKYFEQRELNGLEEYYAQRDRERDRDRDRERERDDVVFSEVWGKFAERLGVSELTRQQFTDLINGEWDGERLVGAGYRKVVDRETGEVRTETGVRTTMIDVVYAAPKSVMTYLVHQEDPALTAAVIDAWRQSVREAFDGMEEQARVARVPVRTPTEAGHRTVQYGERAGEESRMQGSSTTRVTAELIALPVLQLSARPTEESLARGYVADPHLHMHVPVIAVCAVPDPDHPEAYRTYTPDDLGIKRHAEERDAVVLGEFARRLEDLGIPLAYHTDRKGRVSWEVAGIPREAALHFSTNHLRAERIAAEFQDKHGRPPTDAELSERLRMTRLPKDAEAKQVDERGAWAAWHDDLRSTGIDITARDPRPGRVERAPLPERLAKLRDRLVDANGLHREDSVVDRETIRVSIARAAMGLGLIGDDRRTFEAGFVDELIPVRTAKDRQFDLFALPQLIDAEISAGIDIEMRAAARAPVPTWNATHCAIATAKVRLSDEQRGPVKAMLQPVGWANLVGRAGTGKTTVLRTVAEALRDTDGRLPRAPYYERHGNAVPTGGHDPLRDTDPRRPPAADRIIVVSTSAMVARRSGEAIGADKAYSIDGLAAAVRTGLELTDRTWIILDEAAFVDTPHMKMLLEAAGPAVIRAIGDDRQLPAIGPAGWYAEQLAQQPGAELTHVYRQRDRDDVRDFTDLGADRVEQAVRSLHERDRIHVLEEYGQRAHSIVDLYLQERMRGRSAREVRVIVDGSNHVLDDLNGRIQRERLTMEEIGGPPLHVHAMDDDRHWSLYRGDHVVFRERVVATNKEVIRNGTHGEVTRIIRDRWVTVTLEDGRDVVVEVTAAAHSQPLVPAYAVHTTTEQGGEVAVPIYSPSRHATRQSAYTAITRAVEDLHIVIDKETYGEQAVEGLTRDWSRVTDKRTAWSQLGEEGRERWAAWKGGTDDGYSGRHRAAPSRDGGDPLPDRQPPEAPAPSVAREQRRDGSEDIGERGRRESGSVDGWLSDLEEVREAVRDLREVEAEHAADANDHEAAASLIHDDEVLPRRRFGDLDAVLEHRRERTAAAHERAEQRDTTAPEQPPEREPEPMADEHIWVDLEALRQQRMNDPTPQFPPPENEHSTPEGPLEREPEPMTDEHVWVDPEALRRQRMADEHVWVDLDALREQRMNDPTPQFPPPENEHSR